MNQFERSPFDPVTYSSTVKTPTLRRSSPASKAYRENFTSAPSRRSPYHSDYPPTRRSATYISDRPSPQQEAKRG